MVYQHIPGVRVKAEFDEIEGVRYRYWLEIERLPPHDAPKTAAVVMMNPSYATEAIADKSVQFVEKVVFLRNEPVFRHVGRLIVVNQYAKIQTHAFAGEAHEIGPGNDAAIERALRQADVILIAWGKANPFESRKTFVRNILKQMPEKTVVQSRMHPSRGRYEGFILPWEG